MDKSENDSVRSNPVVKRAREYRELRGNWGTHAEMLASECERQHTMIRNLKNELEKTESHLVAALDLYEIMKADRIQLQKELLHIKEALFGIEHTANELCDRLTGIPESMADNIRNRAREAAAKVSK